MKIIDNLNSRLHYYDKQETYDKATKEDLEKLKEFSPIDLPQDYLEFLTEIMGVAFGIDDYPTFEFWSVNDILNQKRDYSFVSENLPEWLIIGTDMGDFLMLYGNGSEGFGLYFVESSCAKYENLCKIADSLTEFLVDGVGFDKCFDY